MQNIEIEEIRRGVYYVPRVSFDVQTGLCWMEGDSCLEDTEIFYRNLIDWLKYYMKTVKNPIEFNFKLNYFNTSSQKGILLVLKELNKYRESGGQVSVKWYHRADDEENVDEAEDFMRDSKLDMQLIPYS